jgi:hypothetical protein
MGGGLLLPLRIPRVTIRDHGMTRLYLDGEALADFVEIVAGIDDSFVAAEEKRQLDMAEAAAKKAGRNNGR